MRLDPTRFAVARGVLIASALILAAAPVFAAAPTLPRRFAAREIARPARTQSTSSYDPLWVGYPLPNAPSSFSAMVPFDGGVAVGGGVYWGTAIAPGVALWDGSVWHPLGDGLNTTIYSLVTQGGLLVAGGAGRGGSSGEEPAIFVWDGVIWTTIGSANGTVFAMVVIGSDLYVGGTFQSINGVAASKIARWDGSNWHAVGAGFSSSSSTVVKALAAHGATLVAGGYIPAVQGIAQWDGANWTQVGPGFQSGVSAGTVNSLVSDGATLYASGTFNKSGGTSVANFAAWNGAAWSALAGATQTSNALSLYLGFPMATVLDGTLPRPQLWNGSNWQPFNHPNIKPRAYALAGSTLYAGGLFSNNILGSTPTVIDPLCSFDGSAWSSVQQAWTPDMQGLSGEAYCAQAWHGSLYVGGIVGYAGQHDHFLYSPGAAQWNGSEWLSIGQQGVHSDFEVWNDSLVAAIDYYVKVWNGSTWRKLGAFDGVSYVYALGIYQGDLYALGPYSSGATVLNGIGRWTGSGWAAVGVGLDDQYADPVVAIQWGSNFVIGGHFASAGGAAVRNLTYWDGSAYHDIGGGVNNGVYALLADGNDLIVGGEFTEAGDDSINGVARWDGLQWHAMGTRARSITCLRAHGGQIYAAGEFLDDESNVVGAAAVWTGTDWKLLGSGIDSFGELYALEFLGDDLYITGRFNSANGHVARSFAKLANVSTLGVPPHAPHDMLLTLAPSPNPSRGSVRLSVTLPAAGRVRLVVRDVAGREVARLLDGEHEAGSFSLAWSAHVAPGLYFATIEAAGARRTARVVRIE